MLKKIGSYLKSNWQWFAVGLVIAAATISGVVFWAHQNYLESPPDLKSPQYEAKGELSDIYDESDASKAYTAEDGVVRIDPEEPSSSSAADESPVGATQQSAVTEENIWQQDKVTTYNSFTLPEKVEQADGSLGVLTIEKIGLSTNVFEAEDEMEAMTKGLAHFKHTTSWDGNIGLCGHNVNFDLTDGLFKNLHLLEKGDIVSYSTELGERSYEVSAIEEISETDWSYLTRSDENKITMITCISGKPEKRLMVQAVEK